MPQTNPFDSILNPAQDDEALLPGQQRAKATEPAQRYVPIDVDTDAAAPAPVRAAAPTRADVIREAAKKGIDPVFALSIWSQESGANFNTKDSPKGARGGMQVMPGTFKAMMGNADQRDPWNNLEAGLRYIAYGQKTLGTTDPVLLAAGYHAGYDRKDLKQGIIPDTSDGMIKTADYARSVAARAGHATGTRDARVVHASSTRSDGPDGGRFVPMSDDEVMAYQAGGEADASRYIPMDDAEVAKLTPPGQQPEQSFLDEYVINPLKRGYLGLKQGLHASGAMYDARTLEVIGRVDRGEKVPPTEDTLGYQDMNPQQRAEIKKTMGDAFKGAVAETTDLGKQQAAIPQDPIVAKASQAKSFDEWWKYFKQAPVKFIANTGVESLPQMAPGLVLGGGLGAAANLGLKGGALVAGAAGMGAGSYAVDYPATVLSVLGDMGIDTNNPDALAKAFSDPKLMDEVGKQAHAHASVVGALDAASGGRAGKTLVAGKTLARKGANMAAKTVEQGVLGAAGEAGGQIAQGKDELEWGSIMGEFAGEMAGAPAEVAGAGYAKAKDAVAARRAQPDAQPQPTPEAAAQPVPPRAEPTMGEPTPAPAAPPSGPLSAALDTAAEQHSPEQNRVTVTAPTGEQLGGQIVDYQEDENGDFVAQVMGDDGQVHTLSSADGVVIEPEAPRDSGPMTEALSTAAEQHAEAPAPAPVRPQKPAEPDYAAMSLGELRGRMKYIAEQAKASGGWNKMFLTARKEVEKHINAKTAEAQEASKPSEEPLSNGPFDDRKAANRMMLRQAEATGVPQEVVEADGKFSIKPIQEQSDDQRPDSTGGAVRDVSVGSAEATAPQRAGEPARGQTDQELGGGGAAIPAGAERGSGTDVPGADLPADTQPALTSEPAPTEKDAHAGKWFSSQEKADSYLTKKNASATHEVVQTGKVRFEVKPKAAPAVAAPAPAAESAPTKPNKLEQGRERNRRQEEAVRQAEENIARRKAEKETATTGVTPAATGADATTTEARPQTTEAPKEPWQMTAKEWADERERVRPNVAQSRFTKASGGEAVGNHERLQQLLYGVTDTARQRLKDAQDGKVKLSRDEVDELMDRINTPVHHADVVAKAVADGKPVPADVLAEYPGLTKTEKPQPAAEAEAPAPTQEPAVEKVPDVAPEPAPSPEVKPSPEAAKPKRPRKKEAIAAAEKQQPEPKDTPAPEEAAPAATIGDFGEKILGARKDVWAGFREDMSAALPEDVKEITLAKNFPEPPYEKLIEAGADPRALATFKALRDSIPAKPRMPYKAKRWGEQVVALREFANDIINGTISTDDLLGKMRSSLVMKPIAERIQLYAGLGYPLFQQAKDFTLTKNHYNMFRGETPPGGITKWELSGGSWRGDYFDTQEEGIEALRKRLEAKFDQSSGKTVQLDLYRVTSTGDIVIGKKVAAGKYIDLKTGFKDVKSARTYLAEHRDELVELLEKKKDVRPERRGVNEPRVGEDHRKGADTTPEQFGSTFGFRGVQFGNYVEQKRRAADLNNAYDALLDMAEIIGVPPKAISLNGTLGLAFGARGKGGKNPAAAHYEPGHVVINLTKTNGAGSLGHEWWHGFDNYFARMRGDGGGFITMNPKQRMVPNAERKMVADESIRPEVLDALKGVVDAIRASGMPKRSKELDGRRTKDYWGTIEELTARAFESYLIDKAAEQGRSNDYLANIVSEDAHNAMNGMIGMDEPFPYPTKSEAPAINAAFDKLFATLKTKEEDGKVALYSVTGDDGADLSGAKTGKAWSGELFHGTAGEEFDTFRPRIARSVWFAQDSRYAQKYADSRQGGDRRVLRAKVTLSNPLVIDMRGEQDLPKRGRQGAMKYASTIEDAVGVAQQWGHDGVIFKNRKLTVEGYSSEEVAVFDPSQIEMLGRHEPGASTNGGSIKHSLMVADVTADAIRRVMNDRGGEVAISRPGIGDITIEYGDKDAGLAHIAARRGEAFMDRLPNLLANGEVYRKDNQPDRIFIGNERDEAVIRTDRDGAPGNWLLSAYEKHPEAKQSRTEEPAPYVRMSDGEIKAAVTIGPLGSVIARLIEHGTIKIHRSAKSLPKEAGKIPAGVQALTMPDGSMHLVAGALTKDNARAVLLHEMFHGGVKPMLGEQAWGELMGRMGSIYRQSENSTGKAREFFDRARERVASAKAKGAVPTRMEVEEFAAYAIEEYERAPDSLPAAIRKWVEDLIGLVKAYIARRHGKQIGQITPSQLAGFAKMAILDMAAERRGELFGPAGELFSASNDPTVEVEGKRRTIKNSKGQNIAPEFKGQVAFWKWFGDSKVVNERGEPLVVYHGSPDAFAPDSGLWFAKHPDDASAYAENPNDGEYHEGANVTPAYLQLLNPLQVDAADARYDRIQFEGKSWVTDALAKEAAARGNDGLIVRNVKDGGTLQVTDVFYVARPAQIKSATGNSGEFDGANSDIRFSVGAAPATQGAAGNGAPAPSQPGLTPPEQGRLRRLQASVQDNQNRVKQVQERIMELTGRTNLGKSDYYGAETNRPGRIAARLEDARDNLTGPLMEKIAAAGKTPEQLGELLHAMHAHERNQAVAKINPDMPDGGSGMTDAQANAILARYQNDATLHALADDARAIARATLDMKHAYGLITDEHRDMLADRYEFYVPLKGDGEYGPKVKRAMGHEEREEHILENIARDYDQAVVVGEKNLARQSLLRMALQFPDPELWTVGLPPKGRYVAGKVYDVMKGTQKVATFDSHAEVRGFLEAQGAQAANFHVVDSAGERVAEFTKPLQDNEIMVFVKGDAVRIQVFDETLARQLRPLDQARMHPILEFMRGTNRFLSKIYTGYNPAFILRNATRDAMTGTINMLGNQGAAVTAKAWARYPQAAAALAKWAATKQTPTGKIGSYLTEYRQQGGKVGASYMSDLEEQGQTLQSMFDNARGIAATYREGGKGRAGKVAWHKTVGRLAHVVEIANQATENALRLGLFIALREEGVSAANAAQAAKQVTVDFDRKGASTGALGAVYLFFNPAIQGSTNALKTLAKGEHRQQAWAALGGLALLGVYAASAGMGGDKDRWLGEEWERRTKNLILNVGAHQLRLPLSQEYAPVYSLGVALAEALNGESKVKAAAHVVSSFIDAYFPLQGAWKPDSDNHVADLTQAVTPTLFKPLTNTALNRNAFGSQIVPESELTKDRPDNLKMNRSTKNSAYDKAAQGIASVGEMLGAGKYENDITKISPETLKEYWRTYTGGLGAFITDSLGLTGMLVSDPAQVELGDWPIAKDFARTQGVGPIRGRYYDLARDAHAAITEFEQAKKVGDGEAIDKIMGDPAKAQLVGLGRMVRATSKAAAALGDEKADINASGLSGSEKRAKLKQIEQEEESLYRSAIQAFK